MPKNLGIHTSCIDNHFQSESYYEIEHDIGNNLFVFQFTRIDLVFNFTFFAKKCKNFLIFCFLCVKISPRPDAKMHSFGGIAQLVEQMTFNHWVQSSNLCASTTIKQHPNGCFFIVWHRPDENSLQRSCKFVNK